MYLLISFLYLLATVYSYCPNSCSFQGTCSEPDFKCNCYPDFTGADCSLRTCPTGIAWADITSDVDTAHEIVECSNRGICQRSSGACLCDEGYFGSSCDKIRCPNDCNSHGRCLSMKTAARALDYEFAGLDYTLWDAEKIFGCVCDLGYFGHDCKLRECDRGIDPFSSQIGVPEVQLFTCDALTGYFTLSFLGETTERIHHLSSIETFSKALKQLRGIENADISFSEVSGAVCSTEYNQVVKIIFHTSLGTNNRIVSKTLITPTCEPGQMTLCGGAGITFAYNGNTLSSTSQGIISSAKGTLVYEFCSGRGKCDTLSAQCECFESYDFSEEDTLGIFTGNCKLTIAPSHCPNHVASCSGRGYCNGPPYFECTCFDGWTGPDCSAKECPEAASWFDKPSLLNTAHDVATCSNRGSCDFQTGQCICDSMFEGAACQLLKCPSTGGKVCSGHGTCLRMEDLAIEGNTNSLLTYGSDPNNPTTWDRRKVQGCLCDDGYIGYDCSLQQCIFGDDPDTTDIESIECSGQGICNRETGVCKCFQGYASSDGLRNMGPVGDCGYKTPFT